MGLTETLGKVASKASELVACIKVMETKFEALEKQFLKLDSDTSRFVERIRDDINELHRRIACLEGTADARNSGYEEMRRHMVSLQSLVSEVAAARAPGAPDGAAHSIHRPEIVVDRPQLPGPSPRPATQETVSNSKSDHSPRRKGRQGDNNKVGPPAASSAASS